VNLSEDPERLRDALAGISTVVHLAGANEAVALTDPDRALADTAAAARQVGEACSAVGVQRVVYVSSVHVYGAALIAGATVSEVTVPQPCSVYAVARLAAEHLLASSALDTVVVRLTNGVGAPVAPEVERWSLVANDLCRQAVTTGELRLRTDGSQWRDFVALDDVCRVLAATFDPSRVPAGTYNLGSGLPLTVRGLAELVQDAAEAATGKRPPLHAPEAKDGANAPYLVASDRFAALGLRAEVPVRAAMDETVRFCLDHRKALERREAR
jgi:UDP-glucose 4-epimerase